MSKVALQGLGFRGLRFADSGLRVLRFAVRISGCRESVQCAVCSVQGSGLGFRVYRESLNLNPNQVGMTISLRAPGNPPGFRTEVVQGYLANKKQPTPLGPP